jgi:pilus assembly protein CpaB
MNRTIIGVISAVVSAAIGTFFLVSYVQGAEDRALAGQETVDIWVVNETIERGTPAEQMEENVSQETVPAKVRADGSVGDIEELDGHVAAVDLVAGEQLVAGRFLKPAELEAEGDVDVPEGLQEITISVEPQRAVGGQLRPGGLVGFLASFSLDDERDDEQIAAEENEALREELSETTKLIVNKVLVTNVQVEQLPQSAPVDDGEEDETGSTESRDPDLAPTGNLLVTLAVDVDQAERMVFTAEHGTVWLSAQDEDTEEDGSRLRTPRNIYDD